MKRRPRFLWAKGMRAPSERGARERDFGMINAGAIIVGDRHGTGAAIYDIAADLGFVFVKAYAPRPMLPLLVQGPPISFVLFGEVPDPAAHLPAIREVRRGSPRSLSFAPLIYFAESPSRDMVTACIGLGFDDIVTMPFTQSRVQARLMQQIEMPLVYFETADYFGPDRRRLSGPRMADAFLRGLEEIQPARRYEIRRNLTTGVSILREQIVNPHNYGAA